MQTMYSVAQQRRIFEKKTGLFFSTNLLHSFMTFTRFYYSNELSINGPGLCITSGQLCIHEPYDPSKCLYILLAFWQVKACSSLLEGCLDASRRRCNSEAPTFRNVASTHF